ncbi:MAG: hypothetical protein QM714_10365 [Nocardioides sp.]|uniref:hypothetical protein n=1 Tax=Nocardioides sp. TaxID=35761 RepID=UPI0039E620BB
MLTWRTVPTFFVPDSTEWQLTMEPIGSGTRITQSFQVLRAPGCSTVSTLGSSLVTKIATQSTPRTGRRGSG